MGNLIPGGSVDAHINLRLGQSCFKLGQMEEALEFLFSAIAISPGILDNEPAEYQEFYPIKGQSQGDLARPPQCLIAFLCSLSVKLISQG